MIKIPTLIPRLSLRSLFLWVACAAIGLATYPNSISALWPTIAAAVVIGLTQQTRQLIALRPVEIGTSDDLRFAWRYAIAWRTMMVALMSICLVVTLIESKGIVEGPDRNDVWLVYCSPSTILSVCILIALSVSASRWTANSPRTDQSSWRTILLLAVGIAIGCFALVDNCVVEYLTHRAMAGIEANISPKFQRPGIYPKLQAEHYGTFWVALLATVCMLAAGAVLIRSPRKATNPRRPAWAYLLFLILLIPAVIFCGWYYGSEFHRLSPELAGSGRVAIWIDWLVGAILAVILVTAGACRLSSSGRSTTISTDLTPDIHGRAFHESFVCLLLLAVYATATLGLMLFELVPPSYWNSRIPFWYQVLSPFVFPESLLVVVVPFIIAFQLICLSWQDRRQAVAWTLTGVSRTEFLVNWIALAMLLTVAVPTLNAFSFVFWLGPFKYLDI